MMLRRMLGWACCLVAAVTMVGCAENGQAKGAKASSGYHVVRTFAIGGEGRWDYLVADGGRLYVPRSDRVMVLDAQSGAVIGVVPATPGVHGVALAKDLGRGFTSNGAEGSVTVFDLKTLGVLGKVKVGDNPDAILFDPASGKVFALNGKSHDVSVFDADIDLTKAATSQRLELGGKPEFAVADGEGHVYVNIEDTNEIVAIDSKSLKATARWPILPGEEPTGLAMDVGNRRLLSVCGNKVMVVVNADTGKVVESLPIGEGCDGAAFDPKTRLAFASNGEGTLTVVREESSDRYSVMENVPTQMGTRTMALDASTHRVYLATARFGPAPAPTPEHPRPRPAMIPGTFTILVVDR